MADSLDARGSSGFFPVSSSMRRRRLATLSVVRVAPYEDGLELINSGAFGNGTAIFTDGDRAAQRFQHEVDLRMIGVNLHTPAPPATFSFED